MKKLSKESAEWHYEKIVALHNFKYLTLAQKVSIFFQDLEHDILRKITDKQEFFDQWNWIKEKQGTKEGSIPPTLVSDIHSFKPWRNEAVHKASPEIDTVTYLKLFQTMAHTIKYFSDISWTIEVSNILNNKVNKKIEEKSINKMKKNINNLKTPFVLIDNEEDIKNNILKFNDILKYQEDSEIINRFSSFTYWYYFSDLDIFVPNKFLGYKNCAYLPYEDGCKMNGTEARKRLDKYFEIITDEKRKETLLERFNKFSKKFKQNVNVNVTFLEPKNEYYKIFNKI